MSLIDELTSLEGITQKEKPEEKKKDISPEGMRALAKQFCDKEELKTSLSNRDYFSLPYYSASAINRYEKNPALINFNRQNDNPFFDSEADTTRDKMLGQIIHKAILEPEEFQRSKELFLSMLNNTDKNVVFNMIEGIYKNKITYNIMRDIQIVEKVLVFDVVIKGKKLKCKMRLDAFTNKGFLLEIKTMPELEQMVKKMNDFRYDLQFSFYMEGLKILGYKPQGVLVIGIEKKKPFQTHRYEIGRGYLNRGKYGGYINEFREVRGWLEILTEMHFNPRPRFKKEITLLDTEGFNFGETTEE